MDPQAEEMEAVGFFIGCGIGECPAAILAHGNSDPKKEHTPEKVLADVYRTARERVHLRDTDAALASVAATHCKTDNCRRLLRVFRHYIGLGMSPVAAADLIETQYGQKGRRNICDGCLTYHI